MSYSKKGHFLPFEGGMRVLCIHLLFFFFLCASAVNPLFTCVYWNIEIFFFQKTNTLWKKIMSISSVSNYICVTLVIANCVNVIYCFNLFFNC